jgi:hypothetical protein
MKNSLQLICLTLVILGFTMAAPQASGQEIRSLSPTIENAPEDPLCPWTEFTLTTQEYDTYQWYRHTVGSYPVPIHGATEREVTLTLEPGDHFYMYVVVTLDGEEATSPYVHIDQYIFPFDIFISGHGFHGSPIGILACDGTDYQITLRILDLQNYHNPKWYKDGQLLTEATGYALDVKKSGYYTGSATSTLCPNVEAHSPGGFGIVIHKPQQPTITQEGDSLLASWNMGQWFFEEDTIPGATHWVLVPEMDGYYSFAYHEYGCPAKSEPYYFSTSTSIVDGQLPYEVSLYPVPAGNLINIRSEHQFGAFEIFDSFGRVVKRGDINGMGIDISELAAGFYHIALRSSEGTVVKKFIKAK